MNQTRPIETTQTKTEQSIQPAAQKAAWQAPKLKQLHISLDTALFGGSNADAMGRGTP